MNFLKSVLLFILLNSLPVAAIYLIFEGVVRTFLIGGLVASYLIVFLYAEKFVLYFLGAREITSADSQLFFRIIKSAVFSALETMPKVYLFSGNQNKAFVFDSMGNWSMAIDRNLFNNASEEQLRALVNFLIENKKNGSSWLQTKCMGLTGSLLKLSAWLANFLFRWTGSARLMNTANFIVLMFLKPIIELINLMNPIPKIYRCPPGLRPIYYQSQDNQPVGSFGQYLSFQLIEHINQEEIIREYLESYPVFERCDLGSELA